MSKLGLTNKKLYFSQEVNKKGIFLINYNGLDKKISILDPKIQKKISKGKPRGHALKSIFSLVDMNILYTYIEV